MRFRWTIEDCQDRSDAFILRGLINERLSDLNPYGPFARRLRTIGDALDAQIANETTETAVAP